MAAKAALGILRNPEHIPKVWKELEVDPQRYVNIREYRDRTEAFQSASALHLPQLYLKSTSEEKQRNKSRRALQSSYSLRAKKGFKYWQGTNNKDYLPTDPVKTRFSFGERFNAGRFGCTNDRYYTNGSQNHHYWSSVESKMTPIGSGANLAEIRRNY